jgi:hypothetical protein
LILNVVYQAVRLYQEPSWDRGVFVALSVLLIAISIAARLQALRAQDRVIRLEERLRYREVLTPKLAKRAYNLTIGKMISLRFAPDEELPELVTRVLDGTLSNATEIKSAIKNWRGDYLRV